MLHSIFLLYSKMPPLIFHRLDQTFISIFHHFEQNVTFFHCFTQSFISIFLRFSITFLSTFHQLNEMIQTKQ